MEVQKEAFNSLMEYYKQLPIKFKRSEIINEIQSLISIYSKLCIRLGSTQNMVLNIEKPNINKNNLTEEEFLCMMFYYLNTLEDISGQFMDTMSNILENK